MKVQRVAVLGAGIMGSSTALYLARAGIQVDLFDAADRPFSGASRWNEGKIHLGFLYANDPAYRTARRILSGGLTFPRLTSELLGRSTLDFTQQDDVYLIHRDSVRTVDETESYFLGLQKLIQAQAGAEDYFVDLTESRTRRLSEAEVSEIGNPENIVAGFAVPERSVPTNQIADAFVEAVSAEPNIHLRMNRRVMQGKLLGGENHDGCAVHTDSVHTDDGQTESYDAVVNALWEGRPKVDATIGIKQQFQWSHRYRLSVFVETNQTLDNPSAVICTGPFGDVKNYGGNHFYISWYPDGLLATGEDLTPPPTPQLDDASRSELANRIFDNLGVYLPRVLAIRDHAERIQVRGGWVFASGTGKLDDPKATLHQRDRIGVTRTGRWWSVDTGKYSIAPWLAKQVAQEICSVV